MKVNFETERLMIRPLVPDDADAAFRWCGDPNVNTYMIYPLYHRAEHVHVWLESRDRYISFIGGHYGDQGDRR